MSYADQLLGDRYCKAALSVHPYLQQPRLQNCAMYLMVMDMKRDEVGKKPMTDDHLKQEAVKWAREHK